MSETQSTTKASRQCWECLKRRLVCDYTLPHCKKCIKKGRQCPGYDAQKPLQWVEPGKVTSRKRAKPSKNSELVLQVRQSRPQMRESKSDSSSSSGTSGTEQGDDVPEDLILLYHKVMAEVQTIEDLAKVIYIESQDRMEEIVSKGLVEEAAKIVKKERDPMAGVRRILTYMKLEQLPVYNLRNETCEVVQAINYFNTRIIPEATGPDSSLVRNPQITYFPPDSLHLLTPAIHSSFICFAIQHYVNRLPREASEKALVANRPKLWQHRGEAIQELRKRIEDPRTKYSLATITSIAMFLTNELHTHTLPQWRSHVEVLLSIMKNYGGPMGLYRKVYHMHPTVVLFYILTTLSNSTSPAHDQIVLAPTLEQELEDVEELYHEAFPYCHVPPSIFFFIIRISSLRREASQALILEEDLSGHVTLAANLLNQIESFSVDDWAQPGANHEDWLAIGCTYKHAAAIYCIMSLQSLALLPDDTQMDAQLESHSDNLISYLKKVTKSTRTQRFISWPLCVAGVDAARRGEARRRWIENSLLDLAYVLGSTIPTGLGDFLKKHWESGEIGWEACFDTPRAFSF